MPGLPNEFSYIETLLKDQTGYTWSINDKAKALTKFGQTTNANAGIKTTVANFQGSVVNETFATANTVDRAVSDNAGDTGNITIEGHTVDLLTGFTAFTVQTVALTGTAPVALPTPLYRCTRIYRTDGTWASPSTLLVGNVYVYDSSVATTAPGGTPSVATATKCMIVAGDQNSTKCATTISGSDAWIITHITTGIRRQSGAATRADVNLEVRRLGGVHRNIGGTVTLNSAGLSYAEVNYEDPLIILPNSDVRMVVTSDTSATYVFGEINGLLAKRVGISGLD